MLKHPPFDSLEDIAHLIAQERGEAGCFIITRHHNGGDSFGTSGMNGDAVRYGLNHDNAVHSGNLAIDYSFIFEERTGQEH